MAYEMKFRILSPQSHFISSASCHLSTLPPLSTRDSGGAGAAARGRRGGGDFVEGGHAQIYGGPASYPVTAAPPSPRRRSGSLPQPAASPWPEVQAAARHGWKPSSACGERIRRPAARRGLPHRVNGRRRSPACDRVHLGTGHLGWPLPQCGTARRGYRPLGGADTSSGGGLPDPCSAGPATDVGVPDLPRASPGQLPVVLCWAFWPVGCPWPAPAARPPLPDWGISPGRRPSDNFCGGNT